MGLILTSALGGAAKGYDDATQAQDKLQQEQDLMKQRMQMELDLQRQINADKVAAQKQTASDIQSAATGLIHQQWADQLNAAHGTNISADDAAAALDNQPLAQQALGITQPTGTDALKLQAQAAAQVGAPVDLQNELNRRVEVAQAADASQRNYDLANTRENNQFKFEMGKLDQLTKAESSKTDNTVQAQVNKAGMDILNNALKGYQDGQPNPRYIDPQTGNPNYQNIRADAIGFVTGATPTAKTVVPGLATKYPAPGAAQTSAASPSPAKSTSNTAAQTTSSDTPSWSSGTNGELLKQITDLMNQRDLLNYPGQVAKLGLTPSDVPLKRAAIDAQLAKLQGQLANNN